MNAKTSNANNMNNANKFGRIILQVMPLIYLSLVITLLVYTVVIYLNSMKAIFDEKDNEAKALCDYLTEKIYENKSYGELFKYWGENYESLDYVYSDAEATEAKKSEFYHKIQLLGMDMVELNNIDTSQLSDSMMKLYAETMFMMLNQEFDTMKELFSPQYLYCVTQYSEDEIMYIFTGALSNEHHGETKDSIYMLGHVDKLDTEKYADLFAEFDKDSTREVRFSFKNITANSFKSYHPILDSEGNPIAVIGISLETRQIWRQMVKSLFVSEILAILIFVMCAGAISYAIMQMVVKPIVSLQTSVAEFGADNDVRNLHDNLKKVNAQNELGHLAKHIGKMGQELTNRMDEVVKMTSVQEKIEAELNLATKIQTSALSHDFSIFPAEWNLDVNAMMDPARQVGGDFYSFFVLDENRAVFVIADVSGKGVPAAMFMMKSKVLIENYSKIHDNPADILAAVNNEMCEGNEAEMFVTVWLGIFDNTTRTLTTANGGHEYPIIKRADGSVELFKDRHGFVLGGIPNMKYSVSEIRINPGDYVILYTDGATESNNANSELYGTDRLVKAVEQSDGFSAFSIIESVRENIEDFAKDAEQFDDLTMMAIGVKGRIARD